MAPESRQGEVTRDWQLRENVTAYDAMYVAENEWLAALDDFLQLAHP